ncbi:alpha-galactosidase [Kutzneria sp. 744]|nr:alpha-galactosidase [Kutzneria sp. 744]
MERRGHAAGRHRRRLTDRAAEPVLALGRVGVAAAAVRGSRLAVAAGDRDAVQPGRDRRGPGPAGAQGWIVHSDADVNVLAKPLANGDITIALFNKSATARNISTSAGNPGDYRLTDLWSHQATETTGMVSADVPAHGVALYRVDRSKASWLPPSVAIVPDVSGTAAHRISRGSPTSPNTPPVKERCTARSCSTCTPDASSAGRSTPARPPR